MSVSSLRHVKLRVYIQNYIELLEALNEPLILKASSSWASLVPVPQTQAMQMLIDERLEMIKTLKILVDKSSMD